MVKRVLFGVGTIGKEIIPIWIKMGIPLDYLADNNSDLWNTSYKGIPILSLEQIKKLDSVEIVITCKKYEEVINQLIREGIPRECIFECYTKKGFQEQVKKNYVIKKKKENGILFDLQNGLVLGGVESWVFQMAKEFQEKGFFIKYLTTNINPPMVPVKGIDTTIFDYQEIKGDVERIWNGVAEMVMYLPCIVVCNFPFQMFEAACMAKEMYPELVKVIAVIHSDDRVYYDVYEKNKKNIDEVLVVSSKIEDTILEKGFCREKVHKIQWNIPCKEKLERSYSKKGELLRLGYAGRITTELKRVDRFLLLAKSLQKRGIPFVIELAGIGPYEEQLQREINKQQLEEVIKLVGYLPRERIPEFWERQDIMVSCSDIEGHSISQEEAMASGAVPVVFDTSGARDDVIDGYHGYVLPVGEVHAMADKIEILYQDRDLLEKMGNRSYLSMKEKKKQSNMMQLWEELLAAKEVMGEGI